jgi:hypothetical protein
MILRLKMQIIRGRNKMPPCLLCRPGTQKVFHKVMHNSVTKSSKLGGSDQAVSKQQHSVGGDYFIKEVQRATVTAADSEDDDYVPDL